MNDVALRIEHAELESAQPALQAALVRNAAIVIGAGGVTGTPMAEQLALAGWRVYGVSRRPPRLRHAADAQFTHVAVDLTDAEASRAGLARCADATHVFYCANDTRPETRLTIIGNALDAIEAAAKGLANVNLLQGTKYYGSYLGPFKTPAKETDPRIPGGDFYYAEEDLVTARQAGKAWTWTAVRPTAVCGYAAGNPLNLATVLAIYGSIKRELQEPFGFPSTQRCFDALIQVIDADLLARAAIWVSTTPGCGNRGYNVSNGDMFRWRYMWPALARFFDLEAAGPQPYSLAQFLADKQPLWKAMTQKYALKAFPFERAARWAQGDFKPPNSRLGCEYDFISDTLRIRKAGFNEVIDSEEMFLSMFERLRRDRVIP
jgi:nucleoside-diphosphate-sugar epimerase